MLKLKSDEASYSKRFSIEQNIRKYSNFVGFPIYVDGERVNTVETIWLGLGLALLTLTLTLT